MAIGRIFRLWTPSTGSSPPAAPTLTVTDNADGTGGVATVTGSTSGASNSIYYAPFTGQEGAQTWTLAGSRSGNGTVALTQQGFFVWLVVSTLSGLQTNGNYFYKALTDANAKTLPVRIRNAVAARITALNLSGLSSVNILEKWQPRAVDGPDVYPQVVVCPADKESFPVVLTGKDDIGEPILVAVVDKQDQDFEANLDRNSNWRWLILSALRYQPLAGVPEVMLCYPEPAEKFDKSSWDKNYFFAPLLFRFLTRTTRG